MTLVDDPARGLFFRAQSSTSTPADKAGSHLNESAFQRLYDATSGPILGYLIAVTGHHHLAEDLLQETYIRFLAQPRPAMDPDETRRYLFRIATNLVRDSWRSKEHEPFVEPVETSHFPNPDAAIDIRTALQSLKPRERELLWLAYVEGMSHAEIASATGLQSLSVRMLLHRARNKAAALLNPTRSHQ
jgi:RNA polymerase sigma-70 factor (ECF subfamily)